jgi:hypothetical protein
MSANAGKGRQGVILWLSRDGTPWQVQSLSLSSEGKTSTIHWAILTVS